MFERFTDRARRVVVLAQEEARLFGHKFIGTEHLLYGLVYEGEGVAARALDGLGIKLDFVGGQIAEIIGHGKGSVPANIPFTPRCKKVLELSLREALGLGHSYIGTEHILLGMIREGEGVGCQIIGKLGVDLATVRESVITVLIGAKQTPARYWRSPLNPTALVDASLSGIGVLADSGWTLVERLVTQTSCPGCGQTHSCDRYIAVTTDESRARAAVVTP